MSIKYYSKASALSAVKKSGKNLEFVSLELRDDEEIVKTALRRGGSIEHASFRLRNSPEFLLMYARSGAVEHIYERALFCAKMDISVWEPYCRLYAKNKEFNAELRLTHGDRFTSQFEKYNLLTSKGLQDELRKIRLNYITYFRGAFRTPNLDLMEEIRESDELMHSFIRIAAVSIHYHHGSFSQVKESIKTNMRHNEREKDYYCSERGSGSFPERVMRALLDQLGAAFEREKIFEWSSGTGTNGRTGQKRYDFYIPTTNTIIEVHGSQHYEGGFETFGGRTLEEEQENDLFKTELAKQNGIKNYIVINAVSSDFTFLRNSICGNTDFTRLYDLSSVNWDAVYDGAIGKKETDLHFPYYEFCQELYQTWYDLIESTETDDDYKPVPRLYGTNSKDAPELAQNLSKAHPSANGLYPHELMILRYAPKYEYPADSDAYSFKWFYERYGVGNVRLHLDKLLNQGFLCISDTQTILKKSTVPVIRKFLADNGHVFKGRKEELVQYVIDNIPEEIILSAFPQKYYMLTQKGINELAESQYLTEGEDTGLSIWTLNRLANAFPYDRMQDIIREFRLHPRQFIPYLTESDKASLLPPHLRSVSSVPPQATADISVEPSFQHDEEDDSASSSRSADAIFSKDTTLVEQTHPLPLSSDIQTAEKKAPYVIAFSKDSLSSFDHSPSASAFTSMQSSHKNCDIRALASNTTVIIPKDSETCPKNSKHTAGSASNVSKVRKEKKETSLKGQSDNCPISNIDKEYKTRKIFILLMIPFLFCTALAISMMLSDIQMLSVVCFFGTPTFMFAILSRSPKWSKYILGREHGIRKGLFVALCLLATLLSPFITLFIPQ